MSSEPLLSAREQFKVAKMRLLKSKKKEKLQVKEKADHV